LFAEQVDDAGGQRRFGPDHGEGQLLALGERGQGVQVGDRQVDQVALARGAAVARRDVDHLDPRRLGEPPGQRMLAATGTDYEDFHDWPVSSNSALLYTCWMSSRFSSASSSFCIFAASSPASEVVVSGRIVISATAGFSPAASSAPLTASKSPGAQITSIPPSSSESTSSAPASIATSMTFSSE